MAEGKIQLSEYQISEAVSGSSYFSSDQSQLVKAALNIFSKKSGGLDTDSTKEMLQDLANTGLISSGGVDSVMRRLFNE